MKNKMRTMETMEMHELREHIGELIEYVQAGEIIQITGHDEIIARVVSVRTGLCRWLFRWQRYKSRLEYKLY